MSLEIDARDLDTVKRILREHVPELEVRVYGSRVRRTARKTSDLDLVLMTERPLDALRMGRLRDAFSESDVSIKVDVADWAATTETFRRLIEAQCEVLQDAARGAPARDLPQPDGMSRPRPGVERPDGRASREIKPRRTGEDSELRDLRASVVKLRISDSPRRTRRSAEHAAIPLPP